RQPGEIAPRSGKARDEPGTDRITERQHDDRDRACRTLGRLSGRGGRDDDDVRLESQAFGSQGGKSLALAIGGEVVDRNRLALDVTQVVQALKKRIELDR